MLISTDKAVAPANMMGLTKSLAERVMLDATRRGDAQRGRRALRQRARQPRLGGAHLRGAAAPTAARSPSPTRDVTRYFMTIPEAARLVLQAQAIGKPGDIFVLEMGEPVKIVDLARKMIALSGVPADIEFVGLRPGEKLHEALITETESLLPTERDKILRVDRVSVPEPRFEADIDALIDCAQHGTLDCVDEVIERLEPGFSARDRA